VLPWAEPEEDMWRWTVSPEDAPDKAEYVELSYKKGDIVAINGKTTDIEPSEIDTVSLDEYYLG
jgi:argininosuccinate synthase